MDKKLRHIKTDTNGLAHGRGNVYMLQYHLVWCTKYRKPVLCGSAEQTCKALIEESASECGVDIDAMEVMPDHIHVLVSTSPQAFIPDVVKILKGNTARRMFIRYPELKQQLYGGHLWNPSYCVMTVSDRTSEKIKAYIENQKTE